MYIIYLCNMSIYLDVIVLVPAWFLIDLLFFFFDKRAVSEDTPRRQAIEL